jgi:hypothetical protein
VRLDPLATREPTIFGKGDPRIFGDLAKDVLTVDQLEWPAPKRLELASLVGKVPFLVVPHIPDDIGGIARGHSAGMDVIKAIEVEGIPCHHAGLGIKELPGLDFVEEA